MLEQKEFIEKFLTMQDKTVEITRKVATKLKPGQSEREIVDMYYQALAEAGLKKHWYPALVYVGESTGLPISRRYHLPSEDVILKKNDIVMLDCTPLDGTVWSNWAETFVVGDNEFYKSLVEDSLRIVNQTYEYTAKSARTIQDIYDHAMMLIKEGGFVSLEPMGDVGHSIFQVPVDQTVDMTPQKDRLFIYPAHGDRTLEGIISIEPQIGRINPDDGKMYSTKMQRVYIAG